MKSLLGSFYQYYYLLFYILHLFPTLLLSDVNETIQVIGWRNAKVVCTNEDGSYTVKFIVNEDYWTHCPPALVQSNPPIKDQFSCNLFPPLLDPEGYFPPIFGES